MKEIMAFIPYAAPFTRIIAEPHHDMGICELSGAPFIKREGPHSLASMTYRRRGSEYEFSQLDAGKGIVITIDPIAGPQLGRSRPSSASTRAHRESIMQLVQLTRAGMITPNEARQRLGVSDIEARQRLGISGISDDDWLEPFGDSAVPGTPYAPSITTTTAQTTMPSGYSFIPATPAWGGHAIDSGAFVDEHQFAHHFSYEELIRLLESRGLPDLAEKTRKMYAGGTEVEVLPLDAKRKISL
jgi:hypothetical protein